MLLYSSDCPGPQVNPPYYVRLVELVPHPETVAAVMELAYGLMTEVGQAPVRLRKEIDGFALNRVQYAIIAESWRLVKVRHTHTHLPFTHRNTHPHTHKMSLTAYIQYMQGFSQYCIMTES